MDVRRRTSSRWQQRRRRRGNGRASDSSWGIRRGRTFLLAVAVLAALALPPSPPPGGRQHAFSPSQRRRRVNLFASAAGTDPLPNGGGGGGGGRREVPQSAASGRRSSTGDQEEEGGGRAGFSDAPHASSSSTPKDTEGGGGGKGGGIRDGGASSASKPSRRNGDKGGTPQSSTGVSNGALVVCGVDGTVYTLDAWTGGLRGLFASGPALVGSSSSGDDESDGGGSSRDESSGSNGDDHWDGAEDEEEDDDCGECLDLDDIADDDYDGVDGGLSFLDPSSEDDASVSAGKTVTQSRARRQRRHRERQKIVPGLDGNLYALSPEEGGEESSSAERRGQRQLDRLPISVMDVVDSPVTTCSAPSSYEEAEGLAAGPDGGVGDEDREGQCGLVMGQRRVTIFSLDPGSGTVDWMQKPGGAHEGFTSAANGAAAAAATKVGLGGKKRDRRHGRGPSSTAGGNRASVLLQREDYYVRSVDVESGLEHWNVTVGRFSALDFGNDAAPQNVGGGEDRGDSHPGGRAHGGRSAASSRATAAGARGQGAAGNKRGKRSPLSLGWTGYASGEHVDAEEQDVHAGGSFVSLPSVAFGEDGNTIMAVDSSTGRLLWRRRIESVVAAVYGVGGGRFGGWVPLSVVDDYDPLMQGVGQTKYGVNAPVDHLSFDLFSTEETTLSSSGTKRLLPSPTVVDSGAGGEGAKMRPGGSTLSSTSLVPYGQGALRSSALVRQQYGSDAKTHPSSIARLGEESSTLFVASTTPLFGSDAYGPQRSQFGEGSCGPEYTDSCARWEADMIDALVPWDALQGGQGASGLPLDFDEIVEESTEWQIPPLPHHTTRMEHGLFLSWRMVSILILVLFASALILRLAYVRQKAKWQAEATPLLVPTNPNSLERDGEQTSGGGTTLEKSPTGLALAVSPAHLSLNGGVLSGIEPLNGSLHNERLLSTSSHVVQPQRQTPLTVRSMSLPHLASLNAEAQRGTIKKKRSSLCLEDEDDPNSGVVNESISEKHDIDSGSDEEDRAPLASLPMLQATTAVTSSTPPLSHTLSKPSSDLFRNTSAPTHTASLLRQTQRDHGVGSIDGIPLVRYSRYRSEFREISALGKGGFGTVFRCENALDGREYAVKKIRIMSKVDAAGRVTKHFSQKLQRVLREVKILALLDHPNIVRYYTAWLELDDEGDGEDNQSLSSYTSRGGNTTRFSSEIPSTFAGPSATLDSVSHLKSQRIKSSKKDSEKARYSATRANPLGWNQFFTSFQPDGRTSSLFDEASEERENSSQEKDRSEIVRCPSSATDEDDLGFTWERSSSGRLKSPPIQRKVIAENDLSSVADVNSESSGSESDDDDSSSESSDSSDSSDSSSETECSMSATNLSTASPVAKGDSGSDTEWVNGHFLSTPPASKHPTLRFLKQKANSPSAGLSVPLPSMSSSEKVPESHQMRSQKHILYIQMQLCSQKTLVDFLENAEVRRGNSSVGESFAENEVDIPYALRLFRQIAKGVKHVHSQGLIHRDLKPSNCFIDDAGNVKIGDFGLSRESAATGGIGKAQDDKEDAESLGDMQSKDKRRNSLGGDDNTIGVGTRSYASPEQMSESDYDSSSDVYSLGIMLFELCYPMSTGMERVMVFKGIRKRDFPDQWHSTVAVSFPSIHALMMKMLSPVPSERPTSAAVADHIDSLLSEYTVLSLDRTHRQEGSVLLRVEATESEGVLRRTIDLIKGSDKSIEIRQYSLRGQESKAIMEFALSVAKSGNGNNEAEKEDSVRNVILALKENKEIGLVRQVTEKHNALSRCHSIDEVGQQPG